LEIGTDFGPGARVYYVAFAMPTGFPFLSGLPRAMQVGHASCDGTQTTGCTVPVIAERTS